MATGLLIRGPGAGTALYSTDANIALTLLDAPFDLGDIVLGNGSRVIFDTSVDQTVDQAIRQAIGATASLEKLGAAELNYSSDGDLIYVHETPACVLEPLDDAGAGERAPSG